MSRKPSPRAKTRKAAPTRGPSRLRRAGDLAALALVGAHAGLLWLMTADGVLPAWLAGLFAALSALTFAAYARDKRAARHEAGRTPELTLHLLELAGGWPGALLAQRALRHKNRKPSYQFAFWACVLLHEATLGHLLRQAGGG
ncbi:DUF1294 domain-containing protein [Stenotrophomonas sp. HITSZ_GD]|uniref:DUF1294 domain-containing protein n=1 Tax=Stenotrophomonas sp. HITSZ_GD TaxID=3037248 RepID=UPI00240D281F|nr:DUF1294 domain-containing protein [Stenotrophomonas sp. HITSZ_GD]MDG2525491.1 DUF1294 domain-containing protein [Stenotrophomonas sp. HITSZ_GD]